MLLFLCSLSMFDWWVHVFCPDLAFFFLFLNECSGETWRGIACVAQQYWKYLKLPEVYFSGKWTVNVMSNQGTLFWMIQSRCESEVWRHTGDDVLEIRTCWREVARDYKTSRIRGVCLNHDDWRSALLMVGALCSQVSVCKAALLVLYWIHDSSYLRG